MDTGKIVVIKSVILPNGNLLIPARTKENWKIADWIEVEPGTPEFKRWFPVSVEEPDPREAEDYKVWKRSLPTKQPKN